MDSLTIKSPAKLNLTLDVTKKRADGYHMLEMVTQTINLFDYIKISKTNTGKIEIYNEGKVELPCCENNIMYKAVVKFFKETKIKFEGINIKILKNIPLEAGLGGGSSNAASVLLALDKLYNTGFSISFLKNLGVSLGADVALFFYGGTCLCQGIGEEVTKLKDLPKVYFVIVKPKFGFSTAKIYESFDKMKVYKRPDTNRIILAISKSNVIDICDSVYNILEQVVSDKEIFDIKSILISSGALAASMTGSGSSVFGIFDNDDLAKKTQIILSKTYSQVFLAEPI